MVIFISATMERNWERFSKHRCYVQDRPDHNELAVHIHKYQHDFDNDIEVLILKGNLHQKYQREEWEDTLICL